MELTAPQLRRQADPQTLGFASTAEVQPARGRLGQLRAEHALDFAMGMRFEGYNLYALGAPQIGMLDFVRERLDTLAGSAAAPDDWCYLNNFDDPANPRVCRLPQGIGRRFKQDMAQFVSLVRTNLPNALSSDEHRRATAELGQRLQQQQITDTLELQQEAEPLGLTMLPTPNGFAFAPTKDGKVMEQDDFAALDEARRRELGAAIDHMNQRLLERLREYPKYHEELLRKQRELTRQTASRVLTSLAAKLRSRYQIYPAAIGFVVTVEAELLENAERILLIERGEGAPGAPPTATAAAAAADQFFDRYAVNLIVDNADLEGAPVIYESNPSLDNLVGKLEHRFEYGMPVADFSMIRSGALHRANGGYLLVDADRLLQKPFAWEALKRAISDHRVRVESVNQMMNLAYSVSLDPDPVPLEVKVVLFGDRHVYHLLRQYDADFDNLFKIVGDFDDYVSWDDEHQREYAGLLSRLVHDSGIRHLNAAAVASALEQSSRLVEDRRRLSARVKDMEDILREADQLAAGDGAAEIDGKHIDEVIARRAYRVDRIRDLVHENITRGITLVDTRGSRVGQVNGLSVVSIGKLTFGQPSRITATARLGRGELIDIEREAKLGGSIHSKAVMIVSNFIGARYAREHPLSLHASLVFEQSYGGIEGDSASIAEVCALISAIIERPLRQDIAVTGSMDQHGTAQAIGGINQKIEGFFDVCRVAGLSGTQGVLMPASNLDNLMLRQDVVDAVAAGQFHVHAMSSVDDAMAVLFAHSGEAPADPAEINRAVEARVRELHEIYMATSRGPSNGR
ncbi:MAG: Lon protease family protein [Pseudomonadales bacterium]